VIRFVLNLYRKDSIDSSRDFDNIKNGFLEKSLVKTSFSARGVKGRRVVESSSRVVLETAVVVLLTSKEKSVSFSLDICFACFFFVSFVRFFLFALANFFLSFSN
jgi:hypothetical protein